MAAVTLSFASGFEAQLTSVWHDILSRGSTRRLEVFCREGMVWLGNEFRGPLVSRPARGQRCAACPVAPVGRGAALADEEVGLAVRAYVEADRAFVEAVMAGRRTRARAGGGARVAHRLVDAAYRSAAGGGAPIGVPSAEG